MSRRCASPSSDRAGSVDRRETPASLWERWTEVRRRLSAARRLLACFDYDGTLTPIRDDPDEVRTPEAIAHALERLADRPSTDVAVISGRPTEELRSRLPESLRLVGHHGMSVLPPGSDEAVRSSGTETTSDTPPLDPLRRLARRFESGFDAVWLEEKGAMIALHTRGATRRATDAAGRYFVPVADAYRGVRVIEGKEVIEVVPQTVSKAKGVEALRREISPEPLVLYAGDDTTDEDVFRALGERDTVTIHVGASDDTHALYRVDSVDDIEDLLERLVQVRS